MAFLDGWRFCPRCAAPLERGERFVRCRACGTVEWSNSVPGVQALVVDGGRVLLGRRAHRPGVGRWDIPGGFLEEGEEAEPGLRRELLEETGLEIEPVEYLGTWTEPYEHRYVLSLTWIARPVGGSARAGDDLAEVRWFGTGELPLDELAFATHRAVLEHWRGRA